MYQPLLIKSFNEIVWNNCRRMVVSISFGSVLKTCLLCSLLFRPILKKFVHAVQKFGLRGSCAIVLWTTKVGQEKSSKGETCNECCWFDLRGFDKRPNETENMRGHQKTVLTLHQIPIQTTVDPNQRNGKESNQGLASLFIPHLHKVTHPISYKSLP